MSVPNEQPRPPQVLIVGDKGRVSEGAETALLRADLPAKRAASTRAGCALASTGQFQVVVATQSLFDGAWKRLIEIASRSRAGFKVIVVATETDAKRRAAALNEGAFAFLDASFELPRLGEVARHALWAAHSEGAGPRPKTHGETDS
jgi:DNA-binding NtrC family response regulator